MALVSAGPYARALAAADLGASYTHSARRVLAELAELHRGAEEAGEDRGRALAAGKFEAALEAHALAGRFLEEIGARQTRMADFLSGIALAYRATGRALADAAPCRAIARAEYSIR